MTYHARRAKPAPWVQTVWIIELFIIAALFGVALGSLLAKVVG